MCNRNVRYRTGFCHPKVPMSLLSEPSRFGSDLNVEVSSSSPGHTKDKNYTLYCSSACTEHNELE